MFVEQMLPKKYHNILETNFTMITHNLEERIVHFLKTHAPHINFVQCTGHFNSRLRADITPIRAGKPLNTAQTILNFI